MKVLGALAAIAALATLMATTTLEVGTAIAQEDKSNGASSLAGPAGGWMPQETPQQKPPIDPAAENPGQSGLEAGIIGPHLKCIPGQPPC